YKLPYTKKTEIGREYTTSKYDVLTDLANRHWFIEKVDAEIQSIVEGEDPPDQCILGLLDLDNFQQLNDRHGREVGDYVINKFASVLREELDEKAI
ncbi:MAG: diguanylate cyclase domain-containing protein, partial [bacterium]